MIGFAPTLQARAVALNSSQKGVACIIALDPAVKAALNLSGGAQVAASGCNVAVNSANAQAATLSGSASLSTDKAFNLVGNYSSSGSSSVSANPTTTGAAAIADPYASLAIPAHATCDYGSYSLSSGSATISAGVYCGNISVSSNASLTMSPGIYVLVGGDFKVSGSANLDAQAVSIALTKNASGSSGTIQISGGSNLVMSPTSSGAMQGVVFYVDRTAPSNGNNTISGGSNASITGSVYIPNQTLTYSGGSSSGSGCLQLIARTFVFSGGSNVGTSCGSLTVPGLQHVNKKGLVVE